MDRPHPTIGMVIDSKYRVDRILGRGAMGVVLAATHLELDQRVAIKLLQSGHDDQNDAVRRFLREARSCAKIQSEHVVRVLDVGRLEMGSPYIVMEYLEGRDLAQVLAEHGPLPITVGVDYILQACDGVAAAHAQGIVHRDLKPSNLFLASLPDNASMVKVIDFGISKARFVESRDAAITQGILGSPVYMSPEQMTMSRELDARCDIWALGVILYELLIGQPPFSGDTIPQVCALVLHATAAAARLRRPEVPLLLEEIIHRCLQKESHRRFAHVGELATYLADFAPPSAAHLAPRAMRMFPAGRAS